MILLRATSNRSEVSIVLIMLNCLEGVGSLKEEQRLLSLHTPVKI